MRILCLIPAMGCGGAERAMSHLVAYLVPRHRVRLVTWEPEAQAPFYPLPDQVELVRTDRLGGRGLRRAWRMVSRFGILRDQIRQFRPDVVLSFMDTMNVAAILSCLGSSVPVVVSERSDPAQNHIGQWKSLTRRLLYPFASQIVVLTQRSASYFPLSMRQRISIIPNAVLRANTHAYPAIADANSRYRIIAAGRLGYEKGYDRLINAFAKIADRYPDWDVVIFGEGEERGALTDQAASLGLARRVQMPGVTRILGQELAASHVLAFPSRYEGFPNALAEGLAAGLPAVGFACVSGVEELIVDGQTGFLVEPGADSASLAEALARLMEDAAMRSRFGAAAREHVLQWAPEKVLRDWEMLLLHVGKRSALSRVT